VYYRALPSICALVTLAEILARGKAEKGPGNPPESRPAPRIVVDQRQQLLRGRRIALLHPTQNPRYFAHAGYHTGWVELHQLPGLSFRRSLRSAKKGMEIPSGVLPSSPRRVSVLFSETSRCPATCWTSQPVSAGWYDLLQSLSWTATARRVSEVLFRTFSRLHLAWLDRRRPERCQDRLLRGLVHQALSTPFGREHDFRRIRCVADYRRVVPIGEGGSQQPGCDDATKASLGPWRAAMRTTLALVAAACPRARLLDGTFVILPEDGLDPARTDAILRQRMPALLRRCTLPAATPEALQSGWGGWGVGPSCVIGPAERLLALADQMGVRTLRQVWPALTAVVWSGDPQSGTRLRQRVGPEVLLLEMLLRPEGPVAIEDPRLGGLRLLIDHGVYFEFLPAVAARRTPRVGLDSVEIGAPYELLLTSPAGAWSSHLGLGVCFERLDPPLLRVVDLPVTAVVEMPATRSDAAAVTPAQGPHRPAAAVPAALPGALVPIPWSTLAGRE